LAAPPPVTSFNCSGTCKITGTFTITP
jgi:hypothetical protein